MAKAQKPLGELALIEQIRRNFSAGSKAITLGIGDDCAILRPPAGCEVLVTTDFTLESRHFRRDLDPVDRKTANRHRPARFTLCAHD